MQGATVCCPFRLFYNRLFRASLYEEFGTWKYREKTNQFWIVVPKGKENRFDGVFSVIKIPGKNSKACF